MTFQEIADGVMKGTILPPTGEKWFVDRTHITRHMVGPDGHFLPIAVIEDGDELPIGTAMIGTTSVTASSGTIVSGSNISSGAIIPDSIADALRQREMRDHVKRLMEEMQKAQMKGHPPVPPAPPEPPKADKPIHEMTLADYRRGVANMCAWRE